MLLDYQFDRPVSTLPSIDHFARPAVHLSLPIRNESFLLEDIYKLSYPKNVIFLEAYRNKDPLLTELEQLSKESTQWQSEGIPLEEKSVQHAIQFVKNSIIPLKIAMPYVEVHSDGEVAFTWRNSEAGLMNIAFSKEGIATWAAYLVSYTTTGQKKARTIKGRFNVEDAISDTEKNIIFHITKPKANGRFAA